MLHYCGEFAAIYMCEIDGFHASDFEDSYLQKIVVFHFLSGAGHPRCQCSSTFLMLPGDFQQLNKIPATS